MFGPTDDSDITLEEDRIQDIPQVTQEDNEMLTNEFTEAEVKSVVFQMEHNKALMVFRLNSIKYSRK